MGCNPGSVMTCIALICFCLECIIRKIVVHYVWKHVYWYICSSVADITYLVYFQYVYHSAFVIHVICKHSVRSVMICITLISFCLEHFEYIFLMLIGCLLLQCRKCIIICLSWTLVYFQHMFHSLFAIHVFIELINRSICM